MPYIKQINRPSINEHAIAIVNNIDDVGELNFAITTLVSEYVRRRPLSYAVLNEVMGVFASAQAEFYRRVVAPYEDKKCKDNGDVYDCIAGFNDKGNWTCP